jgi:hypothetical protein
LKALIMNRDLCTSRNFVLWQGKIARNEGVYTHK